MRFILSIILLIISIHTTLADVNNTATTDNLLPNNNTSSSSLDNFSLDGVQSGSTGSLTNNSTHNGFTITCNTQVNNECGKAFNGELEGSNDMTVSYSGSLVNVTGTDESGNTHISNQKKLDGGIALDSNFSVQNCEWSNSSYRCGQSSGSVDSYTLSMKIKDNDGNILAETSITRTDDAGYNANSLKFTDTLVFNGTGSNNYDWSWGTIDGSGEQNGTKASNLLGAEMTLDFATDEYEPFTVEQIEEINNVLGTNNLTENQIWNVISNIESELEHKIIETGITEKVEVIVEENFKIEVFTASKEPEVIEVVEEILKEEIIKEVKQEIITAIEEEKAPETIAKQIIEEVFEEEILQEPKKELQEEKKEEIKEEFNEESKEEKQTASSENKQEKPKKENKKVIKKAKKVKSNLEKKIDKVDLIVKDNLKNIEVKNIIISDALINDSISLAAYEEKEFYKPKDIYLNQLLLIDNRKIYENLNLASYTVNDPIFKKEQLLNEISFKQKKLLMEIEVLKNGY